MPGVQLPLPSQRPASVSVEPLQACMLHTLPGAYRRQAPEPLQNPSVPQLAAPESAHWFSGSAPAGTGVQTPCVPASPHDMQVPVQGPAQQYPCWHEPEAHSALAPQATPLTFFEQMVPLQTFPVLQSPFTAHELLHCPLVPQAYGSHGTCMPGVHAPAPSQRPASVDVVPEQAGCTHWVPDA
jgi:hypothetical protein